MSAVLIETTGRKSLLDEPIDEETVLREFDAVGPIVSLNIIDENADSFMVWMSIEPAQRLNTPARHAIADLSAIHVMCVGPVLLTRLDEDIAREVVGE